MAYETIRVDVDGRGVATLTLARAGKHNSLAVEMIDELMQAVRELEADDTVRVVVLTGEGHSFCAGADLGWMKKQFNATRDERIIEARRFAELMRAFNTFSKPLIGRIQGQAFGGGMGLISICDVAISVPEAKFGFTETRLGIIPATISPYIAARMGEGKMRQVFMSARLFDAEEGIDLGLFADVVAASELDEAIEEEIVPYLSCSPEAVASAKKLSRSFGLVIDEALIERTVVLLADTWETKDAQEGISAFFEKRKPSFS